MLVTIIALALAPLYASPAKAGVQERSARNWAPAFAGGEKKGEPVGGSPVIDSKDMTPIDAERAFAADARAIGQWTAFRKWSTDDAVMFVPQPVNAHDFLKDRKDPPKAIDWWPTATYISCDGSLAANTGGWKRPDGSTGYFSTLWQRQPDRSWKWIVDGGDGLTAVRPRPATVPMRRAACSKSRYHDSVNASSFRSSGARDGTLAWSYDVKPDGSRTFSVALWDGQDFVNVIDDKIAAPK